MNVYSKIYVVLAVASGIYHVYDTQRFYKAIPAHHGITYKIIGTIRSCGEALILITLAVVQAIVLKGV